MIQRIACSVSLSMLLVFSLCAEKRFAILTASYNNEAVAESSLMSALTQDYDNFHIYYVNACSTDRTLEVVQSVIAREGKEHLVTILNNETRQYPLANHYNTIHEEIPNDEIVVILDGDDTLAHSGVLRHLDQVYSNPDKDVWMTYGQFKHKSNGKIGFNHAYTPDVFTRHKLRKKEDIPSHLRTFYSWLFKKIHRKDLLYFEEFIPMCADAATMIPMAEMCTLKHLEFIPEVLYVYNDESDLNEHQVSKHLQRKYYYFIINKRPYRPL